MAISSGDIMVGLDVIKEKAVEAIKTVQDPELFLDIWFLGLIYRLDVLEGGSVDIDMTFTSPMCPAGPQLIEEVKGKVGLVEGVKEVKVNLVFRPAWQPSDEVKALLGLL